KARAVADRHDHQHTPLHLHYSLHYRTALEHPRRALGQAGQSRGHRGQLIGSLRGKPALNASGRPSEDTTTACATSGTRSTKLVISQLRSCAGRPGVLIRTPLVARSYRSLLVSLYLGLELSSGATAPRSGVRRRDPRARLAGSWTCGTGPRPPTWRALRPPHPGFLYRRCRRSLARG